MSDYNKGWNAAIAAATAIASNKSMQEHSVHPDIKNAELSEGVRIATHSIAQTIAMEIKALKK